MLLILVTAFAAQPGCSKAGESSQPAVATVNRTKIFRDDLQREFAAGRLTPAEIQTELKAEEIPGLTRLIEQELLVQEAQRQGIDRDSDFMRSIERFWKEALITTLITRKQKEIDAHVNVFEPDIEAYYREHYEKEPAPPALADVREEIVHRVREEKVAQAFESWVEELRKRADIRIDRDALTQIQ